ncbi:hypothetical protein ABIB40_001685 [Pedobacter sp. UYP30]|uniref:WG repeat-containing protein n=1 Tax=Pedobacter sp. UYP30 TaxID=1756400 RepID=UPI0033973DBF
MQLKLSKVLIIIVTVATIPVTAKCQEKVLVADTIKAASQSFAPVFVHGRWQYFYANGNILLDSVSTQGDKGKMLAFRDSTTFTEYLGPTKGDMGYTSNTKVMAGVIDSNGHEIVPIVYDSVAVQHKNEWTMMGLGGFDFDYFIAYKNGKTTLFDSVGKPVNLPRHDQIKTLAPNMVAFSRREKWGWFDIYNRKIIQHPKFDSIAYRSEQPLALKVRPTFGNIMTYKNGKLGLSHPNGKKITKPKYQYVYYLCYKTGLMRYSFDVKTHLWGLINDKGKVLSKPIYKDLYNSSLNDERLIAFERNGKVGYFNPKSGKEVIPPIYDGEYGFSQPIGNYITLIKDHKMTMLDVVTGKTIIPLQKGSLKLLDPERANLTLNDRNRFTNAYLNSATSYNQFSKPFYLFLAYSENKKWGIKNLQGKILLPATYNDVKLIYRNSKWFFLVTEGEKQGLFNDEGKMIIPLAYDKIIFPNPNYNRIRNDKDYIRGSAYEQTVLALRTVDEKQNAAAIYNISGKKLIPESEGFTIRFESNNAKDWLSDVVLRLHKIDTTTFLLNTLSGKFITPALDDGEKKTKMFAASNNRFVINTKGAENYLHAKLIDENGEILFQSNSGALQGSFKDGLLTLFKKYAKK